MTNIVHTEKSVEYEMEVAKQKVRAKEELAALTTAPWGRWPEGLAVLLILFALARITAGISISLPDAILLYLAALAPVVVLGYKIRQLERRIELLARAAGN